MHRLEVLWGSYFRNNTWCTPFLEVGNPSFKTCVFMCTLFLPYPGYFPFPSWDLGVKREIPGFFREEGTIAQNYRYWWTLDSYERSFSSKPFLLKVGVKPAKSSRFTCGPVPLVSWSAPLFFASLNYQSHLLVRYFCLLAGRVRPRIVTTVDSHNLKTLSLKRTFSCTPMKSLNPTIYGFPREGQGEKDQVKSTF